jgi:ABC-2 type transport system ATP-binding protein
LSGDGSELVYTYDTHDERATQTGRVGDDQPAERSTSIVALLNALSDAGIRFKDLQTTQSSLEDIFVGLLKGGRNGTNGTSGDASGDNDKGSAS